MNKAGNECIVVASSFLPRKIQLLNVRSMAKNHFMISECVPIVYWTIPCQQNPSCYGVEFLTQ
jgi:hypothetical protein